MAPPCRLAASQPAPRPGLAPATWRRPPASLHPSVPRGPTRPALAPATWRRRAVSQRAPRPRPLLPAAFAPRRTLLQPPVPVPDPPPPPGAVAMHGRLKTRPPDAARRRQREEKLRLYRSAMATLLDKRARGELDAEALALTGAVLTANPDVATCWNLRRCALAHPPLDWVSGELAFVGGCLGVNPKSYGAWHHRGWVLRQGPAPPPAPAERALCDRLLAADPRNFHAWEHRRAVGAEEDPEAELAFAGALLSRDFSNFSAWHHRLRLLSSPGGGRGALPPNRLQAELELVQNAVFTDPTDQSAWLYLRCLLSRATPPPRILCLYANREDATVAVTFSRPVVVGEGRSALRVSVDGSALEGAWRSGEGRPRPSHTWLCDLPPGLAPPTARPRLCFRVTWEGDPAHHEVTLLPDENEAWWQEPIVAQELFWPEVGVAEPQVLQAVAATCRELLELEPHSRGCLLALVLLLTALDPLGYEEELRGYLRDLQEADPLRGGFVADMASRVEVAVGVARMGAGPAGELWLRLPGKALTSLPLLERAALVTHMDLSGNRLRGLPPALGGLQRLRALDVSHNDITTLRGLPPLPRLEELRLDGNPISHASTLAPLAAYPRLACLRLAGTPLAAAPEAAAHLAELLPHVDVALA